MSSLTCPPFTYSISSTFAIERILKNPKFLLSYALFLLQQFCRLLSCFSNHALELNNQRVNDLGVHSTWRRLEILTCKMQTMDSFSVHGRRLLENRKILRSSAPIGPPVERLEGSREVPYVVTKKYVLIIAIIISALFCSLLCALVVTALIRCRFLCRRWRVVSEPSLHEDLQSAQTTSKKIDIKALPVTMCYMDSPFAGKDCPICLAEFMDGEKVRVLPECSHSFHADCIDKWLLSNPSCPSCRHSLPYILLKKPSAIAQPAIQGNV